MTDFFKFIGKDGSMGFWNGRIYLLTITDWSYKGTPTLSIIKTIPKVFKTVGEYCPYDNCETFFENWERVK